MNVPNMITLFRIFLIPVFLLVFHSELENRVLYSGIIFLAAGVSDVLDGYIARKQNLTSKLGAVFNSIEEDIDKISKKIGVDDDRVKCSLGSLGSGNHFIEIQKGTDGYVWIMVHSGSRNIGFTVANHYHKRAGQQ